MKFDEWKKAVDDAHEASVAVTKEIEPIQRRSLALRDSMTREIRVRVEKGGDFWFWYVQARPYEDDDTTMINLATGSVNDDKWKHPGFSSHTMYAPAEAFLALAYMRRAYDRWRAGEGELPPNKVTIDPYQAWGIPAPAGSPYR